MKNFLLLLMLAFMQLSSMSQKVITNYWGWTTKVKEQYQVDAQGVMNGYYKYWDEDGLLYKHFNYSNGVENGLCIEYYGTGEGNNGFVTCYGKAMFERQYNKGEIVWEKDYNCVNKKQVLESKLEKLSSGKWKFTKYYPSGKIDEAALMETSNGPRIGQIESYFENGKVAISGKYEKGHPHGMWYSFSETGDTLEFVNYYYGVEIEGKYLTTDKKLFRTITVDENWAERVAINYDEQGNITRKIITETLPFKEGYECSDIPFKSRKEYASSGINCSSLDRDPFSSGTESYTKFDIHYDNGLPTDTNKLYLFSEEKYGEMKYYVLTLEQYEYQYAQKRRFELQQELAKVSEQEKAVAANLNSIKAKDHFYSTWLRKPFEEINYAWSVEVNDAYQLTRGNSNLEESIKLNLKMIEFEEKRIALYKRCDEIDASEDESLKDPLKKATTLEEKIKLLGL
jgi:antitoxin component YwqK of YwqJK toxin-antitoxin module